MDRDYFNERLLIVTPHRSSPYSVMPSAFVFYKLNPNNNHIYGKWEYQWVYLLLKIVFCVFLRKFAVLAYKSPIRCLLHVCRCNFCLINFIESRQTVIIIYRFRENLAFFFSFGWIMTVRSLFHGIEKPNLRITLMGITHAQINWRFVRKMIMKMAPSIYWHQHEVF